MLESLKDEIARHITPILHADCDAAEATDVAEDILDLVKPALAEAEARGYARGLDEAAIRCEAHGRPLDDPYASADEIERYANQHETCHMLADDIRSLATTPSETGESALAALEGGEQP